MDSGEVAISIDIEESYFSLEGLFYLVDVDFIDCERVFYIKVERFSCRYFIEFDHFVVGRLDDCDDVWANSDFLFAHELDWIRGKYI